MSENPTTKCLHPFLGYKINNPMLTAFLMVICIAMGVVACTFLDYDVKFIINFYP